MIQGEQNPPQRAPQPGANPACEKARERIRGFLDGDRPLADDRALRAHLERCETCNGFYRDSLLLTARIGREQRLMRQLRAERGPPDVPLETQRTSKLKRFRAVIVPFALLAAFALLFTEDGTARKVHGRLLEGRATTAGRDFDPEAARELVRGEWLETEVDARLALESEGTRLELYGGSRLLVEEPSDLRFRLERGHLAIDGPCSLRGAFGAIDSLGGKASLTVGDGRAQLASETARIELTDSTGSRTLEPGQSIELVPPPR